MDLDLFGGRGHVAAVEIDHHPGRSRQLEDRVFRRLRGVDDQSSVQVLERGDPGVDGRARARCGGEQRRGEGRSTEELGVGRHPLLLRRLDCDAHG